MYSIQVLILSTNVPYVKKKVKVLVYISHKYIQSLISFSCQDFGRSLVTVQVHAFISVTEVDRQQI